MEGSTWRSDELTPISFDFRVLNTLQNSGKGQLVCPQFGILIVESFQLQGALSPDPRTRGSAPGPHWGLRHQTPVIGSRSALAMSSGTSSTYFYHCYWPTMQCNSKTYYQMFQLSAYVPNLCQPKSSVRHWSIIWSVTVCWMIDQLSFRCRLNPSTSRTEF